LHLASGGCEIDPAGCLAARAGSVFVRSADEGMAVESTDPFALESRREAMPGKIKKLIDQIIQEKSGGKLVLANVTMTKLILKGINPQKFDEASSDDPAMIAKVTQVAKEMGVALH
jgi:hypothetical protein